MSIVLSSLDRNIIKRLIKKSTRLFKAEYIYLFGHREFRKLRKEAATNRLTIVEYANVLVTGGLLKT